jgi:acetyl-CoA C-acetyltransferase
MTDIVIVSAQRTAIGAFNGALSSLSAADLGSHAISAALQAAKLAPQQVDEVIMGHVLGAAAGMGPARQAAMSAGIPKEKTAYAVNQICGSGLRAVANGMMALLADQHSIIVAGGMESMSQSPHCLHLRNGTKMGPATMIDTMINDGLWDVFNNYHMGITAENIASQHSISRAEQDEFALASQLKAEAAIKAGKLAAEITPITLKSKKGDMVIAQDEFPRFGSTLEGLTKLKPAFKPDGTVTAGNASGINDGAAAVVLMRAATAQQHGLKPLARIASWATAGVDPAVMGTGPIPASQAALQKAGWQADKLDLVESNEAFAAQACAVSKALGLPAEKVNVNGGAIALGHPIGASGCRVLVTLLHELQRRGGGRGLATLCIGGGMGIAMCAETS